MHSCRKTDKLNIHWINTKVIFLTGKYMDGMPDDSRANLDEHQFIKNMFESKDYIQHYEKVKQLSKLAGEIGIPLVNLALCWCLKNKHVSTVILGASKTGQLKQNLESVNHTDILDTTIMDRIETILKNKP